MVRGQRDQNQNFRIKNHEKWHRKGRKKNNEIIGAHIQNHQGERLGKVTDLIVDSEGRVALVILSHGGFLGIHSPRNVSG